MKFLLKTSPNKEKGLYLFPNNNRPFVVATIEQNNGIGRSVDSWWQGTYFYTIDDALKELSKYGVEV